MLLKFLGGVFVFISCSLLGLYYSFRESFRISDLSEMKKALLMLRAEIEFSHAGLPEALLDISCRTDLRIGEFFKFLHDRLNEKSGAEVSEIWNGAMSEKLTVTSLAPEDFEYLERFGKTLGYLDAKMQTESIEAVVSEIDDKIDLLNVRSAKNKRMYRSVGIISGILITVVLL